MPETIFCVNRSKLFYRVLKFQIEDRDINKDWSYSVCSLLLILRSGPDENSTVVIESTLGL